MYLLQRLRSGRKSWINIQRRSASATREDAEEVDFGNTKDVENGKCHPSHSTMIMRKTITKLRTKHAQRKETKKKKKNVPNAFAIVGRGRCGDNGESSNAYGRNIQISVQSNILPAITGVNHIFHGHNSSTFHSHRSSRNHHASLKATG
jgi:hypothetical protein